MDLDQSLDDIINQGKQQQQQQQHENTEGGGSRGAYGPSRRSRGGHRGQDRFRPYGGPTRNNFHTANKGARVYVGNLAWEVAWQGGVKRVGGERRWKWAGEGGRDVVWCGGLDEKLICD